MGVGEHMLLPGQAPKSLPVQPSPPLSLFAGTDEDKALESDSHLRGCVESSTSPSTHIRL